MNFNLNKKFRFWVVLGLQNYVHVVDNNIIEIQVYLQMKINNVNVCVCVFW